MMEQVVQVYMYGMGAQSKTTKAILDAYDIELSGCIDRQANWGGGGVLSPQKSLSLDAGKTAIIIALGATNFKSIYEIDKMYADAGFHYIYYSAEEFVRAHFPGKRMKPIWGVKSIGVTTQLGCPIDCNACPQNVFVGKYSSVLNAPRKLTLENFKRVLERIPFEVDIGFGGFCEPFLNNECPDMLVATKHSGRYLAIGTTLVGLDFSGFDKISEIDIDGMTLHLPDKEGNAKIVVDSHYLEILRLYIERFGESLKPDYFEKISIHGELHPKVRDLFEKIGFDWRIGNYTLIPNDRAGNLRRNGILASGYRKGKLFCAVLKPNYAICQNRFYNLDDLIISREMAASHMLPDCSLVVCCNDWGMRHVLGNLLTDDPETLMSDNWRDFQNGLDDESIDTLCRTCGSGVPLDGKTLIKRKF